jgi:chaperonin cofactor prefoldin
MPTITLSIEQFSYLQAAIRRDEAELDEMAPWDIDDETEAHEREMALCREVGRLLSKVEQEQVVAH